MLSKYYIKTQTQKAHENQKIFTVLQKNKQDVIFLALQFVVC